MILRFLTCPSRPAWRYGAFAAISCRGQAAAARSLYTAGFAVETNVCLMGQIAYGMGDDNIMLKELAADGFRPEDLLMSHRAAGAGSAPQPFSRRASRARRRRRQAGLPFRHAGRVPPKPARRRHQAGRRCFSALTWPMRRPGAIPPIAQAAATQILVSATSAGDDASRHADADDDCHAYFRAIHTRWPVRAVSAAITCGKMGARAMTFRATLFPPFTRRRFLRGALPPPPAPPAAGCGGAYATRRLFTHFLDIYRQRCSPLVLPRTGLLVATDSLQFLSVLMSSCTNTSLHWRLHGNIYAATDFTPTLRHHRLPSLADSSPLRHNIMVSAR